MAHPKKIHFLASEEHFQDHLIPIYHAVPLEARGTFWALNGVLQKRLVDKGIPAKIIKRPEAISHIVVASYGDVKYSRRFAPIAARCLVQHGAGQSYFGTKRSAGHPSYSGGRDHDDVGLFLVPNEFSGEKWQQAYPQKQIRIIGSPRIQMLPQNRSIEYTVALSFHWNCGLTEETKNAFVHFKEALESLPKVWHTIGHCHPRARKQLAPFFNRAGIPFVDTFEEVCEEADVYVCDNSSTIFEFAATGRPVVLMNPPHYRKDVSHGMRFWDLASIGPNAHDVPELLNAVDLALADPPDLQREREHIVGLVYPVEHAAEAAREALLEWL